MICLRHLSMGLLVAACGSGSPDAPAPTAVATPAPAAVAIPSPAPPASMTSALGTPMTAFGVRFAVADRGRFAALQVLFAELKRDKGGGKFRDPAAWIAMIPESVKPSFHWPSAEEREAWLAVRARTPIAIGTPAEQLGTRWDFYRVFEAIEGGEYTLVSCDMVDGGNAEMRIEPGGYPYGGLGPLIALVEGFGFDVLGVNESGRYRSRAELRSNAR